LAIYIVTTQAGSLQEKHMQKRTIWLNSGLELDIIIIIIIIIKPCL